MIDSKRFEIEDGAMNCFRLARKNKDRINDIIRLAHDAQNIDEDELNFYNEASNRFFQMGSWLSTLSEIEKEAHKYNSGQQTAEYTMESIILLLKGDEGIEN